MFSFPHPAIAKAYSLGAIPAPARPVQLRLASAHDARALVRLAQLDTAVAAAAELPAGAADADVLVAEHDGELIAAVGISDGLLVSDPGHRSSGLTALLHRRRHELANGERRHRRWNLLRPRRSAGFPPAQDGRAV